MSDAQAEAERIVQRIVGDRLTVDLQYDALVAALAAAIEVDDAATEVDALRGSARQHGKASATIRAGHAWNALRDALSALRQNDGEDT